MVVYTLPLPTVTLAVKMTAVQGNYWTNLREQQSRVEKQTPRKSTTKHQLLTLDLWLLTKPLKVVATQSE